MTETISATLGAINRCEFGRALNLLAPREKNFREVYNRLKRDASTSLPSDTRYQIRLSLDFSVTRDDSTPLTKRDCRMCWYCLQPDFALERKWIPWECETYKDALERFEMMHGVYIIAYLITPFDGSKCEWPAPLCESQCIPILDGTDG